jgi:uncharacterized protein with GYD domain
VGEANYLTSQIRKPEAAWSGFFSSDHLNTTTAAKWVEEVFDVQGQAVPLYIRGGWPKGWPPKKHKFLRESAIMPTYILLSTLTPEGRRTLLDHPDRLELVNMEISNLGCKVIAQYAVLGPYDFVTTIEAPDNATIARLSVSLGARGTINIMTLPAIPTPELGDKLKEGGHLGP